MSKRKIVRVGTEEDNRIEFMEEEMYEPILDVNPTPTLEELADMCDQDAESRNNHSFVGLHKLLSALLFRRFGREKTTEIIYEIAEYGGLDGMQGRGGKPSAYEDFGLKEDWSEWQLPKTLKKYTYVSMAFIKCTMMRILKKRKGRRR